MAVSVPSRAGERGAALFIVVLVITLLTAIGLFSARAASLVDTASGYNRQAVQTQYLAEYGTKAVAVELGSNAKTLSDRMKKADDQCLSTANLVGILGTGEKAPCYKLFFSELNQRTASNLLTAADPANSKVGSLGATPLDADFVAEMVDLGPAGPTPGFDAGGQAQSFRLEQATVITTGQIRPFSASTTCSPAQTHSVGVSTMRAVVTFGPIGQ